jgi:DNA polymerase IIIc chi subunit
MMDLTVREIDAFAKGHDRARRNAMATALWAVWNGAVFNAHGFAGKRLPRLEPRIEQILRGSKQGGDVTLVISHMRKLARKRGLPKPKPRKIAHG